MPSFHVSFSKSDDLAEQKMEFDASRSSHVGMGAQLAKNVNVLRRQF